MDEMITIDTSILVAKPDIKKLLINLILEHFLWIMCWIIAKLMYRSRKKLKKIRKIIESLTKDSTKSLYYCREEIHGHIKGFENSYKEITNESMEKNTKKHKIEKYCRDVIDKAKNRSYLMYRIPCPHCDFLKEVDYDNYDDWGKIPYKTVYDKFKSIITEK